jgi:hypothetical protein
MIERALSFVSTAAVCLCVFAVGCQSKNSARDAKADDDDHTAHVIPAHKPKDFPTAVRRLRELNSEISGKIAKRSAQSLSGDESLNFSLDIANWLPEIAADSDMPEKPWNDANSCAGLIAADYRDLQSALRSSSSPEKAQQAVKRAAESILALESLLVAADPTWFRERNLGETGR